MHSSVAHIRTIVLRCELHNNSTFFDIGTTLIILRKNTALNSTYLNISSRVDVVTLNFDH